MQKIRYGLIAASVLLLVGNSCNLDSGNLSWELNKGIYYGMISNLLLIVAMIFAIRANNKSQE